MDSSRQRQFIVLLAILFEGALIGVAFLLGWLLNVDPLARWRWSYEDTLLAAAATLPMLVLFAVCLFWPIAPLRRIREFADEVIRPYLGPCSLIELAIISVLAGLGEEMLFRAVAQPAFTAWTGHVWLGLLLASLLFGICHAITAFYVVLAAVLGAYLGWLMEETDNLLVPALAHALYDFVALVVLLRFSKSH